MVYFNAFFWGENGVCLIFCGLLGFSAPDGGGVSLKIRGAA